MVRFYDRNLIKFESVPRRVKRDVIQVNFRLMVQKYFRNFEESSEISELG